MFQREGHKYSARGILSGHPKAATGLRQAPSAPRGSASWDPGTKTILYSSNFGRRNRALLRREATRAPEWRGLLQLSRSSFGTRLGVASAGPLPEPVFRPQRSDSEPKTSPPVFK